MTKVWAMPNFSHAKYVDYRLYVHTYVNLATVFTVARFTYVCTIYNPHNYVQTYICS